MEIKFKRDTSFRKQFFVPDSFAHPAKMDAQLLTWIVSKYTASGETILDPMAGSGTMMLACTLGRNVVLVELEEKFCKMMADNWEQVKMRPQLGSQMGNCQIIQGDARQFEGLVDKIVTSPPYEGTEARDRSKDNSHRDAVERTHAGGSVKIMQGYQGTAENIGNLKSDSYLEAMLQVYQQCFSVLRPQGLMILVTKNFIRNKQVIRLDTDTKLLCQKAGFTYLERYERNLPSQSFWRTIYHQKYPEVEQILSEDVLVFKKL